MAHRFILLGVMGLLLCQIHFISEISWAADVRSYQLIIVIYKTSENRFTSSLLQNQFSNQGLQQLIPLSVEGPLSQTEVYVGIMTGAFPDDDLIQALGRSPLVYRVEPNVRRELIDIDPLIGPLDEAFQDDFQDYYWDIGVVEMWGRGITGNQPTNPMTVAVIDSGVDLDHPDIDDNLIEGYDFVEMDTLPQDEASDSHGSMVAGIISGEINNDLMDGTARGVAGIGGGDALAGITGLNILPIRVAEELDCAQSAQAIDYARTHGADIINMSYGGEAPCPLELEAIQRAYVEGIALVAGAGNNNSNKPFYPAAYGHGTNEDLVLAVAGVYASGVKGNQSNFGEWVDISAPYRLIRSLTKDGGYQSGSGTSFSAPFVSGLVGLLMSTYNWSRQTTLSVLKASADNIDEVNPDFVGLLGSGRINADRASAMADSIYLPMLSNH